MGCFLGRGGRRGSPSFFSNLGFPDGAKSLPQEPAASPPPYWLGLAGGFQLLPAQKFGFFGTSLRKGGRGEGGKEGGIGGKLQSAVLLGNENEMLYDFNALAP